VRDCEAAAFRQAAAKLVSLVTGRAQQSILEVRVLGWALLVWFCERDRDDIYREREVERETERDVFVRETETGRQRGRDRKGEEDRERESETETAKQPRSGRRLRILSRS